MKVYLAAPYASRDQLCDYAAELARVGFIVTSSWLAETHEITNGTINAAPDLDDHAVAKHATDDFNDIDRADILVLFTASALPDIPVDRTTSGGRHVETGYALARGIPVIVVGTPENVFHRAHTVTTVPDWHEAVLALSARLVQAERNTPTPG